MGVVVAGLKKEELADLCAKAKLLDLEFDPDGLVEDRQEVIASKLKDGDTELSNPALLIDSSPDISCLPNFRVLDVFSYLMLNKFSHGFLREHTKSEGYSLMKDGFVNNVEVAPFQEPGYLALRGSVKPRTREKDPVSGASSYFPWVVLTTLQTDARSCILSAFYTCKGGIDGCSRHVQALLYEIIDFRDDSKTTSVTSGECLWTCKATGKERPSLLNDIRVSLQQTPTKQEENSKPSQKRTTCTRELPKADDILAGLRTLQPDACLLYTWDKIIKPAADIPELTVQTLPQKRSKFYETHVCQLNLCDCEEFFLTNTKWSNREIGDCKRQTSGQSCNQNWFVMRRGLITASNVRRILFCRDPEKTVASLLKDSGIRDVQPEAIRFGRDSESKALNMFFKAHRYRHRNCSFVQTGLCLSNEEPFLAASPDAIGSCGHKGCGDFIVEVKSMYTYRNFHPKVAIKHRNFCFVDKSNQYVLKMNTDYFYQMQCQMAVTGIRKGFLVIYTKKVLSGKYDDDNDDDDDDDGDDDDDDDDGDDDVDDDDDDDDGTSDDGDDGDDDDDGSSNDGDDSGGGGDKLIIYY
ncbi:hypothetical protein ElyMa_003699800 [Elysia marginata]|uniref:YqaJ viral recombinase domain-containing protein n=1 Tax=Elysia marginata TaxID=1093978 RepID=A0AAV4F1U0_9GAST|nr:hypothetical protein ElyMa_003699800 [Elysia marginata]